MAGRKMVYRGSTNGTSPIYKRVPVNINQTIYKGSIVVKTTGKASAAADAAATGTVWGVSSEDIVTGGTVTAADTILIDVNPASIYTMPFFSTGTKTSFTDSDIGTLFDLKADAYTLDPDDTTGGTLELSDYNNSLKTASVLIHNRVQNA